MPGTAGVNLCRAEAAHGSALQAEKEGRVKEAKREVSRIQMEAEARKQELTREAAAQKRAAEGARREGQARLALERNLELQRQWRESEALKQVWPLTYASCLSGCDWSPFTDLPSRCQMQGHSAPFSRLSVYTILSGGFYLVLGA